MKKKTLHCPCGTSFNENYQRKHEASSEKHQEWLHQQQDRLIAHKTNIHHQNPFKEDELSKRLEECIDVREYNHLIRHATMECSCEQGLNSISALIVGLLHVQCSLKTGQSTQGKSSEHENDVKNVLLDHNFVEISFGKKNGGVIISTENQKRLKEYIRKIHTHNSEHASILSPSIGLHTGLYFVHQPLGSQMPPDFVLIHVSPEGDVICPLECKSGKKIMWNDSLPKKNYVYLATATNMVKLQTSLFTGDDECMCILLGRDTFSELNLIEEYTKQLRDQYKHLEKNDGNHMKMKSFPRSNFSSNHIPSSKWQEVLRFVFFRLSFLKNDFKT